MTKTAGVRTPQEIVLKWLTAACKPLEVEGKVHFQVDEFKSFQSNFERAIKVEDSSFLFQKRGRWVSSLVDIVEFVESPMYMDQKGFVRPAIMSKLVEFFASDHYVEAVLCLSGDTVVPLLDGSKPTLQALATERPNDKFWLYSQQDGKMVPALARLPRKTGRDVLWEVTFTDGTSIKGNSRHQLVTTAGVKVKIADMNPGDRISSLYLTKRTMGEKKNASEYLTYPEGAKTRWVHRAVMLDIHGPWPKTDLVHHRNWNSLNNDPSNLKFRDKTEHAQDHKELAIKNIDAYNARPFAERSKTASANAAQNTKWTDERRRAASKRMSARNLAGLARFAARTFWDSEEGCIEKGDRAKRAKDPATGRFVTNHVVEKVECLHCEEDVYCLTVDKTGVFFIEAKEDQFVLSSNTGAIGIGKNYFADMAIAYMLYNLSTYHNPQLEFDLAPGSSIIFVQQSKTLTLAKKVVFDQFSQRLRASPYFSKHFPFDKDVKSELRFPKQITIMPVGGSDSSALGMNVYGGIIDELNFMARTEDSVETRYTGEDEYDQAERLYTTLIRRMTSRFDQMGKLPGKLLLVSSRYYPGDFTDKKMAEAREEIARSGQSTIFVMNYALWESPPGPLADENFLVEVGDDFKSSRIIQTKDEAKDQEDVIEVPMNYFNVFQRDLDSALRDIGGIVTGTKKPFIPYREAIVKAQESYTELTGGKSLFTREEVVFDSFFAGEMDRPDWARLVSQEYIEEVIEDPTQLSVKTTTYVT